jgi:antirestriction protein ArdC
MPTQNEIREKITATIIQALESGKLLPWRRPWCSDPNAGPPTNVASGKQYRGINPLLLQISSMRHCFASKLFGTFKQWELLGGKVKRRPDDVPPGEWGTSIIFFKPVTIKDEEDEEKTIFVMRTYVVFNIDQVEGSHLDRFRVGHGFSSDTDPIVTYEAADRAIEAVVGMEIRTGGNRAFYNRVEDYIQIPLREQFDRNAAEYYETVFHEMVHASEHPTRLNWNRADGGYALGELVAEMGSCFLASELGIPNAETLPNHASYLQSWLQALKSDNKFIFEATKQANKAADYILSFSRKEQPEPEEVLAE